MERQWIDQVGIMETNTLGAGRTMHAISSYWKHQVVAIKIPRCVHQDPFETAEYNRFMYDIFFEMQVMTHKSLSSHPNIVKLLGVSFVTTVKEKDVQIFPLLLAKAAQCECPPYRCGRPDESPNSKDLEARK